MSQIEWGRLLRKLSPYTIKKGLLYLKHYGPKEFLVRLGERFEPEEVPYGPWYGKIPAHRAGACAAEEKKMESQAEDLHSGAGL